MNSKILKFIIRDMIKVLYRVVKSRLVVGGYFQVRILWGKKKDKNLGK